ncbi:hypothetical protein Tco_0614590 [Tanacetum coccineum]
MMMYGVVGASAVTMEGGGGGDDIMMMMMIRAAVAVVSGGDGEARGGACWWGSNRSEDGARFWYPQMKELYDKPKKSLLRKRKATTAEPQPSKKLKLRTETIDELRNYLRIVDFEKSSQDRESLEAISVIRDFKIIHSPDGEYIVVYLVNNHFRAFNTLWEILYILDRQDLYHLYLVIQDYYKNIQPTGLGLILLGDLTTIWEKTATSDDDLWMNQEDWEILRWRINESSGVHTLELEDGIMLHMLAERRYPLTRELMIRMLDHGMEVEDENETAITLINLFILWTTENVHHGLLPFLVSKDQTKSLCSKQAVSTQTDCIQDTAQKMKLKRLKASIATMTRQTDAEQRRPTIKKLEVKQVEFKLGEDCWEIQV